MKLDFPLNGNKEERIHMPQSQTHYQVTALSSLAVKHK